MSKTVLTLACAGLLLLASAELRAGAQGPAPEVKPAAPEAKPEETTPGATPEGPETEAANGEPVSLGKLTTDGFEIRATDYIPAEAVTRHSGKVSADAIIVTLQKSAATAVCFYTLKAYVGKTLTTIPACTVHR